LNPIELFFAKFKHWLRKATKRSTEAVYNAIGPILDTRHFSRVRKLLRKRRI
jgi:transposase